MFSTKCEKLNHSDDSSEQIFFFICKQHFLQIINKSINLTSNLFCIFVEKKIIVNFSIYTPFVGSYNLHS